MTFDPKNKADKAQLYPVLKALADLDPRKTPELIMDDAVGYPIARGTDDTRNMRRGEINATFAKLTYAWLERHHFDLAHRISPEIFPQTVEQRWQATLDAGARTTGLRIVPAKTAFGIVQRGEDIANAETSLKLGQSFLLELTNPADGHATALQRSRNQWNPIVRDIQSGDHGRHVVKTPMPPVKATVQ